jgi:hypothetical protein
LKSNNIQTLCATEYRVLFMYRSLTSVLFFLVWSAFKLVDIHNTAIICMGTNIYLPHFFRELTFWIGIVAQSLVTNQCCSHKNTYTVTQMRKKWKGIQNAPLSVWFFALLPVCVPTEKSTDYNRSLHDFRLLLQSSWEQRSPGLLHTE